MTAPLWIIDGTSTLLRPWFAGAPGTSPDGRPCGAVRAFASRLRRFVRQDHIAHGVVVFDISLHTFRRDLDPRYKAHRPEPPDTLIWEFAQAEAVARAMGFGVYATPHFEADDLAATFCRLARSVGRPARVVADDKDLFQLVVDADPSVAVVSLRNGTVWDHAAVVEKMGVRPDQVVDFQALVGDATDGVEGVKGIGAKTAAGLLRVAPLEALLANPSLAASAKVRGAKKMPEKLSAGADIARLARELVRLRDDVPLETAVREGTVFPAHNLRDGFALTPPQPQHPVWSRLGRAMPK